MKFKRAVSLIVALVMICSVMLVPVSAKEATGTVTNYAVSDYIGDYDRDTPVIIVHGMSQNDTYLLNEDGTRMTDDNGDYITGWPLEIDVMALIKQALVPLIASVVSRSDAGLTEAMRKGAYDGLYAIHKDPQGNYLTPVEVPCYEYPMSEMTDEIKEYYYNILPLQGLAEIVGEENIYYFGYDSFGDVIGETEKLHHYIHDVVLPQSGAEQVRLCNISLGGTIGVNYLESYPEDNFLIKRMLFVIPAIDGSDIIGDILTDNLSIVHYDEMLYSKFLPSLLGQTPLAYLLNMVLRILPKDVLKSALSGLAKGVVDAGIRSTTIIWALCPTDYYEEAREIWLADEEYALIREKVDYYMQARANFGENLYKLMENGTEVFDIVCYGGGMFPLCKDYNVTNGDGIVHSTSASMGATFANVGETLPEDYVAAGTYCNNPAHDHISPDRTVDPTTGLLPCTTWYIKNQDHEKLPHNDVALKMAFDIMTDDAIVDVYSRPDVYPQYNEGRLVNKVREYLEVWETADKSQLSDADYELVQEAVDEINKQLSETIVNTEKWKEAEEELRVALISAGLMESTDPTDAEKTFTSVLQSFNEGVNFVFDYVF
ncbi:MAG: hypothetical protein E7529_00610 [Ruminococcaceae bacterium]|nr:hypothetical protein [Oscillospiraceae bacterium]